MHNEFINAIILGLIEGITEFLPVSSTGHLIIAEQFFRLHEGFSKMFEVVIQLGAILSVVIYFREKLFPPVKIETEEQAIKYKNTIFLWLKSALAVVPALIVGAIGGKHIKAYLFNPWVVAGALFAGGIFLIFIESKSRESKYEDVNDISFKTALYIGIIQLLAMIPGTSRSAATIIGGMFLGASRKAAAEFSFFLAIPTMAAASAYELWKYNNAMTREEWIILGLGFFIAFLTAWGVIALFMNFIKTRTFCAFGYYRIILAIIVVNYFLFFHHS